MGLYNDAEEEIIAGEALINSKLYRQSIFHFCLAVELYLKSKLMLIDPNSYLEFSHNIIDMYARLQKKYPSSGKLNSQIKLCRKYYNESRYPYDNHSIYTKEFAEQFLSYAKDVKSYIDNDCLSGLQDLENKYKKNN